MCDFNCLNKIKLVLRTISNQAADSAHMQADVLIVDFHRARSRRIQATKYKSSCSLSGSIVAQEPGDLVLVEFERYVVHGRFFFEPGSKFLIES